MPDGWFLVRLLCPNCDHTPVVLDIVEHGNYHMRCPACGWTDVADGCYHDQLQAHIGPCEHKHITFSTSTTTPGGWCQKCGKFLLAAGGYSYG